MPRLPFWSIALVLIALLSLPTLPIPGFRTGGRALLSILVLFPALLALGVVARTSGRLPPLLGLVSFPLYVLHFPLYQVLRDPVAGVYREQGFLAGSLASFLAGGILFAISLFAGVMIERPLSRWRHQRQNRVSIVSE